MAIRDWLKTERQPADLYDLLGRRRFDPHREELLEGVRTAYADLLPYQNHADPQVAARAVKLQRELGRAEDILSDPQKIEAHHGKIVASFREAYGAICGDPSVPWSLDGVQEWLEAEGNVVPDQLPAVAEAVLKAQGDTLVLGVAETQAVEPVLSPSYAALQPSSKSGRPRSRRLFHGLWTKEWGVTAIATTLLGILALAGYHAAGWFGGDPMAGAIDRGSSSTKTRAASGTVTPTAQDKAWEGKLLDIRSHGNELHVLVGTVLPSTNPGGPSLVEAFTPDAAVSRAWQHDFPAGMMREGFSWAIWSGSKAKRSRPRRETSAFASNRTRG